MSLKLCFYPSFGCKRSFFASSQHTHQMSAILFPFALYSAVSHHTNCAEAQTLQDCVCLCFVSRFWRLKLLLRNQTKKIAKKTSRCQWDDRKSVWKWYSVIPCSTSPYYCYISQVSKFILTLMPLTWCFAVAESISRSYSIPTMNQYSVTQAFLGVFCSYLYSSYIKRRISLGITNYLIEIVL